MSETYFYFNKRIQNKGNTFHNHVHLRIYYVTDSVQHATYDHREKMVYAA